MNSDTTSQRWVVPAGNKLTALINSCSSSVLHSYTLTGDHLINSCNKRLTALINSFSSMYSIPYTIKVGPAAAARLHYTHTQLQVDRLDQQLQVVCTPLLHNNMWPPWSTAAITGWPPWSTAAARLYSTPNTMTGWPLLSTAAITGWPLLSTAAACLYSTPNNNRLTALINSCSWCRRSVLRSYSQDSKRC